MLKNWKDKILSFAAGALIACTGFAVAGLLNNGEGSMSENASIMQNWFSDCDELGWVSSGIVSAKAEELNADEPCLTIVSNNVEYSSDIMESINRAAASCGGGKKGGSSLDGDVDGEGGDPMLRAAIELALESDKISTSLIQRRLSLGYGRAAKLIDEMEKRGFVSPPDGQKPRKILITKQQYMEMVLDKNEDLE